MMSGHWQRDATLQEPNTASCAGESKRRVTVPRHTILVVYSHVDHNGYPSQPGSDEDRSRFPIKKFTSQPV